MFLGGSGRRKKPSSMNTNYITQKLLIMAEKTPPKYALPVVAISLAEWVKGCKTDEQLNVCREYCQSILNMHYGTMAGATIFRLMELCDKHAEYLKYRVEDPHETLQSTFKTF